jgi:hypothetical protein
MSRAVAKNISLYRLVETSLEPAPSYSIEGRLAIVTNAEWDAVDAKRWAHQGSQGGFAVSGRGARRRTTLIADGEVVWS